MKVGRIDTKLIRNFSKPIDLDEVVDDLSEVYKITNIADDDSYNFIAEELYYDYIKERANYKAYIKEGMDARILMEVRKSAIIPLAGQMLRIYDVHSDCETVEDIKAVRTRELKFLNSDYDDADWQYYAVIRYFLRSKSVGVEFNFEDCYADAGRYPYNNIDNCKREFLSHLGVE